MFRSYKLHRPLAQMIALVFVVCLYGCNEQGQSNEESAKRGSSVLNDYVRRPLDATSRAEDAQKKHDDEFDAQQHELGE